MKPSKSTPISPASMGTGRRSIGFSGLANAIVYLAIAFACLALSTRPASAQISYNYTGNVFTLFSCGPSSGGGTSDCSTPGPNANTSYTATDFVSATITLATPLGPNLNFQDITGLPGFSLTMSDGQQTLTTGVAVIAEVSTDASGNIIAPYSVFINVGNANDSTVQALDDPGGNGVADQGVLVCCGPTPPGNLALTFTPGHWNTGPITVTHSFGAFGRVIQMDNFNGQPLDNLDLISGAENQPVNSPYIFSSFGGVQTASARYTPFAINGTTLTAGPTVGAYSSSDQGFGSARSIAYATFTYSASAPAATVRVNAVLDGIFIPNTNLPNGTLQAGAALHVYDNGLFTAALTAGAAAHGGSVGQFLLGSYTPTQANSPDTVFANLDSLLSGASIGQGNVPTYLNGPFSILQTANISATFPVTPGQTFTVMLDVATSSITLSSGIQVGAGQVDFINTFQPAANFFTDTLGDPISGITLTGSAPVIPPGAANITLAAGSAAHTVVANVTDSTSTPVANAIVKFNITAGPNMGMIGNLPTDVNGNVTFAYNDLNGPGTDTIQATIAGISSNSVNVIWAATPVITWANPTAITYGTALSGTQLNATANAAGTFTYTPPATTVLTAGSQTLSVSFSPADPVHYTTATATVTLVVNKAVPMITWTTPPAINYGTALGGTQLDASANVPGTFLYSPASGNVPGAGTPTLSVSFTPTDTTDYSNNSATVILTVNKATPVITWATPSPITAGTPLSGAQLDASANVPGTFVYAPASGAILGQGNQPLSVAFTPNDTADYNNASGGVTLVVNPSSGKTNPVITWPAPAAITYGTPLGKTQLDATANVAGTFVYTPKSGTILTAGSQTLSVLFTPTNTTAYNTATATVTLQVNQASPLVLWIPIPLFYGTPLGILQLDALADVPGSLAFTPAAGAVLKAGEQPLSAVFTPKDTTDFSTITLHSTLIVLKGIPQITWAIPASITAGTALSATQLDATANVPGTFVYNPPIGTKLSAGQNTLTVTFTPTDTADYDTVKASVTLTVKGSH